MPIIGRRILVLNKFTLLGEFVQVKSRAYKAFRVDIMCRGRCFSGGRFQWRAFMGQGAHISRADRWQFAVEVITNARLVRN